MADNVTIPATGSGTATPNVATDDVAGVHFQKVKLDVGGDGASVAASGDAANGLDVDVTRLPALPAGSNNIGDVDIASAIPAGTNRIGAVRQISGTLSDDSSVALTAKVKSAVVATSGNNAFIAAVASKIIRVLSYQIQARGTVLVKFFDTQGTPAQITNSPEWDLQAREGAVVATQPGGFLFETVAGQGVQVNLSAAISVMVSIQYVEV